MDKISKRKAAESASLSRIGSAILKGNKVSVKWIPEGSPELGYTSGATRTVNVAWYNETFFKMLSETESSLLRMGVFAHELLHQCLTNFAYTNDVCKGMSQAQAAVFMKFANTLEDPAIEYFAPNIFGGRLLDALRFSIRHIYKLSPGIDKAPTPFSQLINALIHFGDMGIVKGNFTFPETYDYFVKIAPLYNEGITCPDSKRRIDIAKECMELTQPLWEEEVKDREAFEKLLDELLKMLEARGLHLFEDEENSFSSDPEDSEEGERRSEILKKISKKTDNSSNSSKESKETTSSDKEFAEEDTENDENKADASDNMEKPNPDAESITCGEDITTPEDVANEITEGEYVIDEKVLNSIEQSIKDEERKIENDSKVEKSDTKDDVLPDYTISSSAFKSAKCLNKRVESSSVRTSELYKQEINKYNWEIKNLKKTLNKIFQSDMEEANRSTSGSYNIKRGSIGTSARIFDKRRSPGNLKNAAIVLAVDLSGSMSGSKVAQARKTCIVFAEALSSLKIPYYIMGFSADTDGADAVHTHFVDWRGLKRDRETLVAMQAYGNNFDGYSIRYAMELLKEKQASNKILFVISDGEPACHKYSISAGLADTTNAIKDARKVCTVFGIALGTGCNPNVLQNMYGKDFIYCQDEKLLSNTLCKKLEKVIKNGR